MLKETAHLLQLSQITAKSVTRRESSARSVWRILCFINLNFFVRVSSFRTTQWSVCEAQTILRKVFSSSRLREAVTGKVVEVVRGNILVILSSILVLFKESVLSLYVLAKQNSPYLVFKAKFLPTLLRMQRIRCVKS